MENQNNWMTVKEAAKISGYHIEYVRSLIRTNKIAGQKFGWQWMVSEKSLINYLISVAKPYHLPSEDVSPDS